MPHVTCDRRSFLIDGERILLQCGAFQYFRLPTPDAGAWRDALLRLRRAGYNAIDLYFPWNYHSPAPGVYDFAGIRDVARLLRLVDKVGLYLVARPGPYICAEVDAGGLPGWLVARDDVISRCRRDMHHADSPAYLRHVTEWYEQIVPLILQCRNLIMFQIENEYFTEEMSDEPSYMQFLYDLARRLGVTVPIMHNDAFLPLLGGWADVVDVTTVDMYPVNFKTMTTWRQQPEAFFHVDSLAEGWADLGLDCPIGLGEYQGGWFDAWGGPGYEVLRACLGEDYHRLLVGSALGQGATLYSLYMFHGGTTWGFWGEPRVYTSYDYAAPAGEAGTLARRYYQAKRLAMTAEVLAPVLADAVAVDDVTDLDSDLLYAARTDGRAIAVFLRNLTDRPQSTELPWREHVVPVTVPAHGLHIVPLDLPLGPATLVYSTAEPILNHVSGDHRLLVLARNPNGDEETVFEGPPHPDARSSLRTRGLLWDGDDLAMNRLRWDGETLDLLMLPPAQAERVWPAGDVVLVGADYVGDVRAGNNGVEADVEMAAPGQVLIWSPEPVRVRVNGRLTPDRWDSEHHLVTIQLPGPDPTARPRRGRGGAGGYLPALGPWESNPGSPERLPEFDDGDWQRIPPGAPLHMDAHGIHRGVAWYRGRFTRPVERIVIDARHCYDVFLNGVRLTAADSAIEGLGMGSSEPPVIEVPPGLCRAGENVLIVLVESLGHGTGFESDEAAPCGLLSCELEPARSVAWRVRGGLWHSDTPDTLVWCDKSLPESDPAVVWHRTSFALDLPANHRVPVGLRIKDTPGKVFIYLNGLLVGRYWHPMGPQTLFYLPEGLLHAQGHNELVLAHWRHAPDAARDSLGPV
ncbi:MAG: beta-galactosidase, partial [Chloroflexi bacterium]|nr:beta-galactosidase [Chloroflexota bacterium]